MKIIGCVLFLLCFFSANADYCRTISGHWVGRYTDHGPYNATLAVSLLIKNHQDDITGRSLALHNGSVDFSPILLQGRCKDNQLKLWFKTNINAPEPIASTGTFINPNEIVLRVHWQNAMVGGYGPMLIEKVVR